MIRCNATGHLDAPGRVGAFGTCSLKANRRSRGLQPYALWIEDVEVRKIRLRVRAQLRSGITDLETLGLRLSGAMRRDGQCRGSWTESGFSRFQFRTFKRVSEAFLELLYAHLRGWEESAVGRNQSKVHRGLE